MERSRKVKVDKFLSRSGNLAAQQAFQKWFETATETGIDSMFTVNLLQFNFKTHRILLKRRNFSLMVGE